MLKIPKFITTLYIVLLGAVFGASVFSGAVVAPVTFHSELYLGSNVLTQFQEGLIMSENFIRLGYIVDIAILTIILYEGYRFKSFERDTIGLLSASTAVLSGLLFSHYYIPLITQMQSMGTDATKSKIFENNHFASELDLKLFTLSILILLVRNIYRNINTKT